MNKYWAGAVMILAAQRIFALDFGVDAEIERNQQHYEGAKAHGDIDVTTTTLTPYMNMGAWHIGLELPYEKRDYSFSGVVLLPRLQRSVLITKGRTESGVADATLSVDYSWSPQDFDFWLRPGLSLKADNGDASKGLGSGTQEVTAEVAAGWGLEHFGVDTYFGQTMVTSDNVQPPTQKKQDYMTWGAGVWLAPVRWLEISARYDDEEKTISTAPDAMTMEYRLTLSPLTKFHVYVYDTEYPDQAGLPKSERGFGMMLKL